MPSTGYGFWSSSSVYFARRQYPLPLRDFRLPAHLLFPTPLLTHGGAMAGDVEFQHDPSKDQTVDVCRRGHGGGKGALPPREDRVGGDAQGRR